MTKVRHPYGPLDHQQPAFSATIAATVDNGGATLIEPAILTGALLLNLTIDAGVKKGALLYLKVKTTDTEVTTLGTGITGPTVTGVAGKTWVQTFVFDGTAFVAAGVKQQID